MRATFRSPKSKDSGLGTGWQVIHAWFGHIYPNDRFSVFQARASVLMNTMNFQRATETAEGAGRIKRSCKGMSGENSINYAGYRIKLHLRRLHSGKMFSLWIRNEEDEKKIKLQQG